MEPPRGCARLDPDPADVARPRRPRLGLGRLDRSGHPSSRSSTAGSSAATRSSATSRRRSSSPAPWARNRRSTRTTRATRSATAPRAPASSARSRRSAGSSASACSAPAGPGSGRLLIAGPALGDRAGRRRRQHEPLDDEAGFRGACSTSSPTPPTSTGRSSWRPRTTCPSRAIPWRFSSVLSVGSHELRPRSAFFYNPSPPVEFFARGVDVEVPGSAARASARPGTASRRRTSPACARCIRAKHPELTPFQVKSVLYLTADNVWRKPWLTTELRDAVAAGVLAAEAGHRELLQSIVEVARAIFGARASSIFLLDERDRRARLRGGRRRRRVIAHRPAAPVEHRNRRLGARHRAAARPRRTSRSDPRFARDVAESTGYVPKSLMAVPLLHGERRARRPSGARPAAATSASLSPEMELLGLFAKPGGDRARPARPRPPGARRGRRRVAARGRRPTRGHARRAAGRAARAGARAARRARARARSHKKRGGPAAPLPAYS